jgi:hypothetical protein
MSALPSVPAPAAYYPLDKTTVDLTGNFDD